MNRLRPLAVAFAVLLCWVDRGTIPAAPPESTTAESSRQAVTLRGNLDRSRATFAEKRRETVAFLGGSITEMDGYRPMVCQSLRTRFPTTEFTFVNAGIASTCSHTGAFRLPSDVLQHRPDLLLVEFAVNDDQDAGHSYQDAVRGMEGIVRAARLAIPDVDIIVTHFVNPSMLETVQRGEVPTSIRAHEAVAEHYGISTCNVAVELADQIAQGKTTWKIYGGVHPKPAGNRIAADLVDRVFDANDYSAESVADRAADNFPPRALPAPLDADSFFEGRFLDPSAVTLDKGWTRTVPDWKNLPGSFRSRFAEQELTVADEPGAVLEARFRGNAFGLYVLAGPDAGAVDVSIDGGPWKTKDLYHRFSKGLHYPRTVVLQSGLDQGQHTVKLRVSETKNKASSGHAIRVLHFVAN